MGVHLTDPSWVVVQGIQGETFETCCDWDRIDHVIAAAKMEAQTQHKKHNLIGAAHGGTPHNQPVDTLSVCLSVCLHVCLSVCLPACLHACLAWCGCIRPPPSPRHDPCTRDGPLHKRVS